MPSPDASSFGPTSVTQTQHTVNGVAVVATNSDDIASVGVDVSVGSSAGVGVSGTVDIANVNTNATIGKSALINDPTAGSPAGNQSVVVTAANQYRLLVVSASVAIGGGAGVAIGVNVGVLNINATALIDNNATVNAAKDIVVSSNQSDTITAITFTGAGGTAGVAGAVGVMVVTDKVYSKTGTGVTMTAGNNLGFFANDSTSVIGVTGGVAGGFVGVGLGVYILG